MKTGAQTTYILLSRGDEDRRLFEEIDRIIDEVFQGSRKEFYRKFRLLTELRSGLRDEIDALEVEDR